MEDFSVTCCKTIDTLASTCTHMTQHNHDVMSAVRAEYQKASIRSYTERVRQARETLHDAGDRHNWEKRGSLWHLVGKGGGALDATTGGSKEKPAGSLQVERSSENFIWTII